MNRRSIFAAVALTLSACALKAHETSYTVKVTSVDRTQGEVEAQFVIVPQDLRIVCHGEVRSVFQGDYVKVEAKDGVFKIGGATCNQIRWLR